MLSAPESAQEKASTPHRQNLKTQNSSPRQLIGCAYLCNGAFTFALYEKSMRDPRASVGAQEERPVCDPAYQVIHHVVIIIED